MRQTVIIGVLVLASGMNFAGATESVPWNIRSYMEGSGRLCQRTGLELLLRSDAGAVLGTHRMSFAEGVRDEEWPVGTTSGSVTLELHRIDCGGVRARVAELETEITALSEAKQVYVAAVANGQALDPRFIEVDTYARSSPMLSARRDGATLVLANSGAHDVHVCGEPSIQTAQDEFQIRGEWKPGGTGNWAVPPDVSIIEPGGDLVLRRTGPIYVPPDSGEPTVPEAIRVMLAVKPERPTHVLLGELPHGFLGFPGCDFVYVPRSVTPSDRIWPRGDAEP